MTHSHSPLARRVRLLVTGLLAAAVTLIVNIALAPAASADSYNGCAWPRVCFYQTDTEWYAGTPNAAYKDVTYYYQNLSTAAKGSDRVHNTRNDDRAWLRYDYYLGGTYELCLPPNHTAHFQPWWIVNGISIQWEATCPASAAVASPDGVAAPLVTATR